MFFKLSNIHILCEVPLTTRSGRSQILFEVETYSSEIPCEGMAHDDLTNLFTWLFCILLLYFTDQKPLLLVLSAKNDATIRCLYLREASLRTPERFERTGERIYNNPPRPPLLLELLRWNLGPGNNISLGISSGQRPLCSFCACSNDSFWNVVRRYRPAFWHVKMT